MFTEERYHRVLPLLRHLQDEVAIEPGIRTRHDIARVHRIFVLDEAKAVHKLDLGDLASAMGVEVVLNIGLGSYSARGPVSEFRGVE
jgi:hypothetical protein